MRIHPDLFRFFSEILCVKSDADQGIDCTCRLLCLIPKLQGDKTKTLSFRSKKGISHRKCLLPALRKVTKMLLSSVTYFEKEESRECPSCAFSFLKCGCTTSGMYHELYHFLPVPFIQCMFIEYIIAHGR